MSYQDKYLKYKNKYIQLKNQYGGAKINDTVVDIVTRKVWGKIIREDKKVWFLDSERIVKKINEGKVWEVTSEKVSSGEVTNGKVTNGKVPRVGVPIKKVIKQNAMLNVIKPLTEYNIYSVYWIYPNASFRPIEYGMEAIFKIVVSARNDQEAFDFIQTLLHEFPNDDTIHFWSNKSQLVFHLIGRSNLDKVSLICKDSQVDTG